ncbi:MAG TPA: nucleotidyltransferase family protein [Methylocystis sp.]|nr:nucleotidyltransferase family protein [Methylocystis sp.]
MPNEFAPATAMVFAAGLGKRMRPLTDAVPKPLVRVNGKALIDHVLDDLAAAGVARAVVNVHHLGDDVQSHVAARRSPEIVISDERATLLDQGGGIKKALPHLGDAPFFICNTDAFWKDGGARHLRALADIWDPERMDVALLLARTKGSVGVDWDGDFARDAEGRLSQPPGARPYVYAGVGLIKPELFAGAADEIFPLAPYFFAAARAGRLFGVASDALWLHVGTLAAIAEAEAALAA